MSDPVQVNHDLLENLARAFAPRDGDESAAAAATGLIKQRAETTARLRTLRKSLREAASKFIDAAADADPSLAVLKPPAKRDGVVRDFLHVVFTEGLS